MPRNLNLEEGETDSKRKRKETISWMEKQISKTVQLEHLFPGMGGRNGRGKGRRRGKGKTGNHMLWKYKKQALRFPEHMGIELNTREKILP